MSKLYVPDKRLHLPPPSRKELEAISLLGGFVELGGWDRYGRLFHQKREPCRSPVKAFLQFLCVRLNAVTISPTRTDGTAPVGVTSNVAIDAMAALNDDTHGIVVGTGTTAVDITDYKLATQISQGSTAGKLVYNADVGNSDVTVADPNCTFDKWRNFNNNSGAAITVAETGIYIYYAGHYFCFARDVPASVAVPDGGGCYVKYTLKISE